MNTQWFSSLDSDIQFQVIALGVVASLLASSIIYVSISSFAESPAARRVAKKILFWCFSPFFIFFRWYFKLLGI